MQLGQVDVLSDADDVQLHAPVPCRRCLVLRPVGPHVRSPVGDHDTDVGDAWAVATSRSEDGRVEKS